MKSLLWIQSDSHTGEDYLYIDEKLIPQSDELHKKGTEKMFRAQDFSLYSLTEMEKLRKKLNSPNFIIYCNPLHGFCFKSIYNEKAADGRMKTVMYWCKYSEAQNFAENIEKFSKAVGYTLREADVAFARNYISRRFSFFSKALKVGIAVGIVSVAALIFINYNCSRQ